MKLQAWYGTLGIVGLVGTAIAGAAGCTTTTTVGDGGVDDAGPTSDGNVVEDAATDTGALADAASCGAISFGDATCDTCVQASCCAALAACDTVDSSGLNDAGQTACERILVCAQQYAAVTPDASLDDSVMTCDGIYTEAERQTTMALTDCIQTNCATPCSGL